MKPEQEPKYNVNELGRIYNRETGNAIPDDEPVFILRARDIHAVDALVEYLRLCKVDGHKTVVMRRLQDFKNFAADNPERMREPGSHRP
jgi:hypothetical protein